MTDAAAPVEAAGTSPSAPDARHRWRCAGCGNLTRFDVVSTRRVQEFWHVGLGGAPAVDESTTLSEVIEQVSCRWCGRSDAIEVVERPDSGADD